MVSAAPSIPPHIRAALDVIRTAGTEHPARPLAFGPGVSFGQPAPAAEGLRAWRVTLVTAEGERVQMTVLASDGITLQRQLDELYANHRGAVTIALRGHSAPGRITQAAMERMQLEGGVA